MITGPRDTVKRARQLRSEMSVPERILWQHLRGRPRGLKFRRQHPAGAYIIDFYCARLRLAIEVDGWAHDSAKTMKRDKAKSAFLRSQGIATTRVPAATVIDDIEATMTRLLEICDARASDLPER
jgi:very-short-patch-repair endonuclease